MTVKFFPKVNRWFIPGEAFGSAIEELRESGDRGLEGICFWLGRRDRDGVTTITQSAILRSPYVKRSPQNITILPRLMRAMHEQAMKSHAILVGQIHSHSESAGIDLSVADRQYGLSVPGYLSLVAPNYCRDDLITIEDCGVHVYIAGSGYTRLSPQEVSARVIIDTAGRCPVIKVR